MLGIIKIITVGKLLEMMAGVHNIKVITFGNALYLSIDMFNIYHSVQYKQV